MTAAYLTFTAYVFGYTLVAYVAPVTAIAVIAFVAYLTFGD